MHFMKGKEMVYNVFKRGIFLLPLIEATVLKKLTPK